MERPARDGTRLSARECLGRLAVTGESATPATRRLASCASRVDRLPRYGHRAAVGVGGPAQATAAALSGCGFRPAASWRWLLNAAYYSSPSVPFSTSNPVVLVRRGGLCFLGSPEACFLWARLLHPRRRAQDICSQRLPALHPALCSRAPPVPRFLLLVGSSVPLPPSWGRAVGTMSANIASFCLRAIPVPDRSADSLLHKRLTVNHLRHTRPGSLERECRGCRILRRRRIRQTERRMVRGIRQEPAGTAPNSCPEGDVDLYALRPDPTPGK